MSCTCIKSYVRTSRKALHDLEFILLFLYKLVLRILVSSMMHLIHSMLKSLRGCIECGACIRLSSLGILVDRYVFGIDQ